MRHDPRVIESYLGGNIDAIERSGTRPDTEAVTGNGHGGVGVLTWPGVRLAEVQGLGPNREAALLAAFGSEDGVRAASVEELRTVEGIGRALAERVQRELHQD